MFNFKKSSKYIPKQEQKKKNKLLRNRKSLKFSGCSQMSLQCQFTYLHDCDFTNISWKIDGGVIIYNKGNDRISV